MQVTPFNFDQYQIRTLQHDDGEVWFVAQDVSDVLEYNEAKDMTRNLDDDEKGRQIVPTLGGSQEMSVINESGLYSAILKSRKPEAKRFKKWVTSEVLPSIRKTGSYGAAQAQKPALPDLAAACNALIASVDAKVLPKKDGAELIRAITLASFHGSEVLFAASKRPTIERAATPAPQIQLALPNGKTPVALSSKDVERAKDAKSMTNLLKEHGYTYLSAQNAYLALAKAGMVLRGFNDGGSKGEPYWIIVGDGLLYGQNVARENKTAPYWYDSTFALLATLSGFPALNLEAARKKGLA